MGLNFSLKKKRVEEDLTAAVKAHLFAILQAVYSIYSIRKL
jgi:hypothetical protein